MKGGASNIGAARLAAFCAQLEKLGRAGSLEGAAGVVGEIEVELARARAALERRIAGLAAKA
jgi:HPt (histidine-containing phosphotransfer) domain-containing protein